MNMKNENEMIKLAQNGDEIAKEMTVENLFNGGHKKCQ